MTTESPMRELFLRGLGLFEVLRTIGYPSEEIFFVSGGGKYRCELQHNGRTFVTDIGPLPDTMDEARACAETKRLLREVQKPEGGYFDDSVIRSYVEQVKANAVGLLGALIAKGVYPL